MNRSCVINVLKFTLAIALLPFQTHSCDLEQYFSGKQVSVEESTSASRVVFRGLRRTSPKLENDSSAAAAASSSNTIYFELINTYKGSEFLNVWDVENFRKIAVTFLNRPMVECQYSGEIPMEYIVFCDMVEGEMTAISVARWDERTDQRIWTELGWSDWSEWSPCSVSCSSGIQQRTRHCKLAEASDCRGYNVEQRHCNLFGCEIAVNPLDLNDTSFFHPSKERWQRVPDRLTAWRLKPNSYIWVPSTQLFAEKNGQAFPREFILFITMRLQNSSVGTIFSLRSRRRDDSYLSLEVSGTDLKLIHVGTNGTDVVRIPTTLDDGRWHQITLSIHEDSVVDTYIDCEWSRTDVLKKDSFDIPDDSDLIIGYLFTGDLEQLTIVTDVNTAELQCSPLRIPIIDPTVKDEGEGNELEKIRNAQNADDDIHPEKK